MATYLANKGLGIHGHTKKFVHERVTTRQQVVSILSEVEKSADINPRWKRDYAIIYLASMFGARVGEIVLYERRQFANIERDDMAFLPTLKRSERIPYVCKGSFNGGVCGRKTRVRADRAGSVHICSRCNHPGTIQTPKEAAVTGVVEIDPPFIEEQVVAFITDYMASMREDQRWLFEGRRGFHVSVGHAQRIFATYAAKAGLSSKVSFHSLRHGRGVEMWSRFSDLILVQKALRQKDVKSAQYYANLDVDKIAEYKKVLERTAFDPLKKGKK